VGMVLTVGMLRTWHGNSLCHLAEGRRHQRPMSAPPAGAKSGTIRRMANFNFISIPQLRQCLESDYTELQACLKAKAWKAVHVLSGSIVEAVLIDALRGMGEDESELDSMELARLIGLAQEKGILDGEAVDLSTVIRKYRNLIHPGRVKRLEKVVDGSGAVIAAQVVEIITSQVAKKKQQTYGYTAEQLLERLRGGSSALPLVTLLLGDTHKAEVERLLIDVLPIAYFEAINDPHSPPGEDSHLIVCYRTIFDATDDDVRTKVAKNLFKIYKNKPEATVVIYEDNFFRGSDLAYLSESERQFIKAHFLPRVNNTSLERLLDNIGGIGPFLDTEEAYSLALTLALAATGEDKELAKRARSAVLREYPKMTTDGRVEIRGYFEGLGAVDILKELDVHEAIINCSTKNEAE